MGWSEKYWEDVKSELEQAATEPQPTPEDDTLSHPAPLGRSAPVQPLDAPDEG